MTNRKQHKSRRAAPPLLVVALALAFTGAASAHTAVPFQASVNDISTNGYGHPGPPCPNLYFCGDASIAGYGAAFWSFDESPNVPPTPVGSDCSLYTGTSTLTLLNDPTSRLVPSTLVLNEENFVFCHPGNSGNTPNFWKNTYGHPGRGNGTWTVCHNADPLYGCGLTDPISGQNIPISSGVFSGLNASGTDTLSTNGALLEGTWSGTVTSQ
jgi:hypothetical protein